MRRHQVRGTQAEWNSYQIYSLDEVGIAEGSGGAGGWVKLVYLPRLLKPLFLSWLSSCQI